MTPSTQSFSRDDTVYVSAFKMTGTVVETLSHQRYKVRVNGITVEVPISQLEARPHASPPSMAKISSSERLWERQSKRASRIPEVDLHGLRAHEAIKVVDEKLDRALIAGEEQIIFIHGKGNGILVKAIHDHLPTIKAVRAFRLDESNTGMTRVYL